MAVSQTHKRAQAEAAGRNGRKEVPLSGGRRLDAATKRLAVEVELSGRGERLKTAASRLKSSGKPTRVLVVPHKDIPKAGAAMKTVGVSGTVRNLTGSTRVSVSPGRPSKASDGRTSRR